MGPAQPFPPPFPLPRPRTRLSRRRRTPCHPRMARWTLPPARQDERWAFQQQERERSLPVSRRFHVDEGSTPGIVPWGGEPSRRSRRVPRDIVAPPVVLRILE